MFPATFLLFACFAISAVRRCLEDEIDESAGIYGHDLIQD